MEFSDLIRSPSRESIRNYDPIKPVARDVIGKILDAGRLAPSASNLQPWRFIIVSSPVMLGKVRACYHREWFREAPLILVVVGFRDNAWTRSFDGYNSVETDLAIAMTHMILAAENEGLGACWVANYDPAILRDALSLPPGQVVFGITPLGYPKAGFIKSGAKKRKPLDEVAEFM
jgi:nitroreductase